jgi:hypothetical protein
VDGEASLLLATDAASEGLNLHQRCRLIVNVELPWTPVRLEQRIGRVDRIGQRLPVHAIHLVAAGTREESTVARLHDRLARVAATLSAVRSRPAGETEVTQAIVCGVEPAARPAPRYPESVLVVDMRQEATRETEHARLIRAVAADGDIGAPLLSDRPVLTHIRPRARRRAAAGCYWGVHLPFSTPDEEVIWSALLCLRGRPGPGAARPGDWRAALDVRWVEELARDAQAGLLDRAREAVRQWRELALARELAIAGALANRRARMAATLIQRGLFDRRAERMAAAQAALLETAARQSEARLERLQRHVLRAAPLRLAFGALVP